ncbi:MAG: hypothetical protein ACLFP6_04255 [Spirochaetaceae bacterium]
MLLRIVTGERDAGKTRVVKDLVGSPGAAGIYQPKLLEEGEVVGYDLVLFGPTVEGVERMAVARLRRPAGEGWFRFRRFWFSPDAFARAAARAGELCRGAQATAGGIASGAGLFLDEAGPLEVEGRGLAPALTTFLATSLDVTVTVRPTLVAWARSLGEGRRIEVVDLSG